MKVAFIHLLNAQASAMNEYLVRQILWPYGFCTERPWRFKGVDWTRKDIERFLHFRQKHVYVHQRACEMSESLFDQFALNGWFTFSFCRHPGDQWCSFYHSTRERTDPTPESVVHRFSLDEFLQRAWTEDKVPEQEFQTTFNYLRASLDLPSYWRKMTFVDTYSRGNFKSMLSMFFKRKNWLPSIKRRLLPRYLLHRKRGEVSEATHGLLVDSQRYQDYCSLSKDGPHLNKHQRFLDSRVSVFPAKRPARSKPVRFIILFEGRAGSTLLVQHMQNHPQVRAFPEELDRIERDATTQRQWLNQFYQAPPKHNVNLKAFGFKTKLTSVVEPDYLHEFIENNQLQVIHLERSNPVKLVVSIVRANRLREKAGTSNLLDPDDRIGKIEIPVDEFQHNLFRLEEYAALRDYVNNLTARKLEIAYEDLLADLPGTLNRVWGFLGVPAFETKASIFKNTPDDLRQAVSNLDELIEAFPQYSEYFSQGNLR